MPEGMSEERKKLDLAYGARMVYTPAAESDVDLALEKLESIRRQQPKSYFVPAQFENPDNIDAHVRTTAPESLGSDGGARGRLHHDPGHGSTAHGRRPLHPQAQQGAAALRHRAGRVPAALPAPVGPARIEGIATASCRRTSMSAARRHRDDDHRRVDGDGAPLAREEGIFCGVSSGANVAGAIKLATAHPELRMIVTLICDTGQRYFSTELCGNPKHVEIPSASTRWTRTRRSS